MSKNRLFTIHEPHILIKMFRTRPRPGNRKKLTQEVLAAIIDRDPRAIREWESGVRLPAPESLMRLISAFVEQRVFVEGKEQEEAEHLWEAVSDSFAKPPRFAEYPPFDHHWFEALVRSRRQDVISPSVYPSQVDWGEAMDVSLFYGREQELAGLERWIVTQRCRLVALLGMGGIGKSALAVKLAQRVQQHFDVVLWRSLRNAPSLEELLTDCLLMLSRQQTIMPESVEKKMALLLSYLRTSRCLLVLDNVEVILQGNHRARAGLYREGYEGYGTLLRLIGETTHQSCLVFTSREKPRGFAALDGEQSPVRSLMLPGLSEETCLTLLRDKALFGPEEAWKTLVRGYAGNPLALKFVACTLQEVFGGDIQAFLARRRTVFGDIRDLLDEQFERLSVVEKGLLYWLAIEREMTSLEAVLADMAFSASSDRVWEVFDALVRHSSWVERGGAGAVFTLQPVIMEYVTDRFTEQMYQEIEADSDGIIMSHALMKAQARDYMRKSQEHLILRPVAKKLLTTLGKQRVEKKLSDILSAAREQSPRVSEYVGANVLHLLIQMHSDLRGWDFSAISIRQAYLRGADLRDVSFAHCHFVHSIFTEAFGNICCVTFSRDGQFLAAGTTGGEIRWWRVATGEHAHVYAGHTGWVLSIALSRDGSLLVSAGSDQTIKVWDVHTGHCLYTLLGHTNWVMSAAFSPDGTLLASGASDHVIKLWDMRTGQCLRTLQGHTSLIRSVAFSPNGSAVASSGDDQTIRLWDVGTGECLNVLQAHTNWVRSIAFSPNGSLLASGGDDQTIRLWDVCTGECHASFQGHTNGIRSVTFSRDGSLLVSGSDDKTVKLWDVPTGQCLRTFYGHTSSVWSVALSRDASLLASGAFDRTIKLWNVGDGQCLRTLQGYVDYVWSVAFAPTGSLLASGGESQMVKLWNIDTGQCLLTLQGHTNLIRSVAFSPNGSAVASSGDDQTIRLWDVGTGECLHVLQGHTNWVRSVAFSPNGSLLASGGDDQTIRLWDVGTGECLRTLPGHAGYIWSVAFSPDGTLLASSSADRTIKLWDVGTGECISTLQGHTDWVVSIVFSPDGTLLASSSADRTIKLWNVNTSECLNTLQGHTDSVGTLAFHPRGLTLASGSYDQTIKLWDVHAGQCLNTLQSQAGTVRSLAFNADGTILATCGLDETIKLWDMQAGTCLNILRGERPYERMNISAVTGLTGVQKAALKVLGAFEVDN